MTDALADVSSQNGPVSLCLVGRGSRLGTQPPDEPAPSEDGQLGAGLRDVVGDMGGEQHRAAFGELGQQDAKADALLGVQA